LSRRTDIDASKRVTTETSGEGRRRTTDREKVAALRRFRDATMNLVNLSGGMAFLHYRRASEEVLMLILGRRPTDDEFDDLLCQREQRS
jgi:hypothetical protein